MNSIAAKTLTFKRITSENLENAENQVINDPLYGTEGVAIEKIFKDYAKNTDVHIVMMKICLLDFTNGTNINKHRKKISLYEIAKKITEIKNIDRRIEKGDPSVVNEIAKCVHKETKQELVNLFSFASKFCHYHNRYGYGKDDYSIFDSVVQAVLPVYFDDITHSQIENWRKDYQYEKFNQFIGDKLGDLKIPIEGKRFKLDHFLWYPNKDKMPIRKKDIVVWED